MESFEFLGGRYNRPEQIMSGPMQAFRAQNAASGRIVFIHRVSTTEAPAEQAALLKLLTTALVKSADAKRLVLDFGEEQGYWYVVTESEPQCALLREWLQIEIDAAAADSGKASTAPKPAPPGPPAASTWKPEDSGEFTRFLQKTRSPYPPPSAAPPPPPAAQSEFTRSFQSGANLPPSPPVSPPASRVEPPVSTPPVQRSEPGEFTRAFRASDKPPAVGASVPPSVQRPPAGEFTRVFNQSDAARQQEKVAAEPPPPKPGNAPPVQPPPANVPDSESPLPPGEFTRFFTDGPPAAAKPPASNPYVQRPERVSPPNAPAGEFTGVFGASVPPPVQRPPARTPPAPPPPAALAPLGEGEFTKMFVRSVPPSNNPPIRDDPFRASQESDLFGGESRNDMPQPLPSSAPAQGEFTRIFGTVGNAPPPVRPPSVVAEPKASSPVSDEPFDATKPATPAPLAPPPDAAAQGPGEFTRIIQGTSAPPAASPGAPPASSGGAAPSIPLPKVNITPANPAAALGHLGASASAGHAGASPSGASASASSALGSAHVSAAGPNLPKPAIPAAKFAVPPPSAANKKMIILFAVLGLLAVLLVLLTLFLIKR